ncbi:hypothetical protein IMZ48_06315 [Candidatus Bathyarchaeota archaeon]|nr:hypothetical protein [Candidatus Bathyarchaeota archaeon]
MAIMSRTVASTSDKGSPGVNRVRANVRRCILTHLQERTDNRSKPSPPLRQILAQVERDMPRLFHEGLIMAGANVSDEVARSTANNYISRLKEDQDLTSLVARQDESQQPHLGDARPPRDGLWGSVFSLSSIRSRLQKSSVQSVTSNASGSSAQSGGGCNTNQRSTSSGEPPRRPDDWHRQGQHPRHFSAGDATRMAVHREDVPTQFADRDGPYRAPGVPTRTPSDATSQNQRDFVPPSLGSWSPRLPARGEYSDSIRDQMSSHGDGQGMDSQPLSAGFSYEMASVRVPQPPQQQRPAPPQHQRQYQVPGLQNEPASVPPPPATDSQIYQPQPAPSSHGSRPGQEYRGPTIRPPVSSQRGPQTDGS